MNGVEPADHELNEAPRATGGRCQGLLDMVHEDEAKVGRKARLVFTCTNDDIQELTRLYGETDFVKLEV